MFNYTSKYSNKTLKQGGKQDKISSFQVNLNGVIKITVAGNTNQKNEINIQPYY